MLVPPPPEARSSSSSLELRRRLLAGSRRGRLAGVTIDVAAEWDGGAGEAVERARGRRRESEEGAGGSSAVKGEGSTSGTMSY